MQEGKPIMESVCGGDRRPAETEGSLGGGFGLHSLRSVGATIYAIIALCFLTFIGIDAYQMWSAKLSLESQRRTEIKHLTEVARSAVQEEYAASQTGAISVDEAKTRAAARLAGLESRSQGQILLSPAFPMASVRKSPAVSSLYLRCGSGEDTVSIR